VLRRQSKTPKKDVELRNVALQDRTDVIQTASLAVHPEERLPMCNIRLINMDVTNFKMPQFLQEKNSFAAVRDCQVFARNQLQTGLTCRYHDHAIHFA
jgi:hypothetical protein